MLRRPLLGEGTPVPAIWTPPVLAGSRRTRPRTCGALPMVDQGLLWSVSKLLDFGTAKIRFLELAGSTICGGRIARVFGTGGS